MTYVKIGGKLGLVETVFGFLLSLIFLFVIGIPAHIAGIAWGTARWHFLRGLYSYGDLDSVRAESDNEKTEFVES